MSADQTRRVDGTFLGQYLAARVWNRVSKQPRLPTALSCKQVAHVSFLLLHHVLHDLHKSDRICSCLPLYRWIVHGHFVYRTRVPVVVARVKPKFKDGPSRIRQRELTSFLKNAEGSAMS